LYMLMMTADLHVVSWYRPVLGRFACIKLVYLIFWNMNPLTPRSFLKVWHIFAYIFEQKYDLPQFHEIGH